LLPLDGNNTKPDVIGSPLKLVSQAYSQKAPSCREELVTDLHHQACIALVFHLCNTRFRGVDLKPERFSLIAANSMDFADEAFV
jgi:hypothetical protein